MDSESLAKRIAEETVADLEKEKTVRELESHEVERRLRSDMTNKESEINKLKDMESELLSKLDTHARENEQLSAKLQTVQEGRFQFECANFTFSFPLLIRLM